MNTKQAMEIIVGAGIDPSFNRAFQSIDKQFKGLAKDIDSIRKKQKLIKRFEIDTAEVGKARVQLNAAQKAVMQLRREVAKNPTKKLTRDFEQAKLKAGRLSDTLDRKRDALRKSSRAMRDAGVDARGYQRESERLNRSLSKLEKRQRRIAHLNKREQHFKSNLRDMRSRAMGYAAAGASTAYALRPGVDFQSAASGLQAKSSGMTDSQREMLENQAKALQLKMKFTGAEVLEGQTFLAMAGFNPAEIKAASKGMLDLAAASGMGLAESADISSNILSGFNLEAKEMGRVSDVLTKTFTSSNVTLGMLGETMKYVAPVASKAGASLEEVAAMTGMLGNVGIQGSMAGTALRAAFTRLSAPRKKGANALKELGISTKDGLGNLRSMPVVLDELRLKLSALGSGDRAEFISHIFGVEASAAMEELINKAGDTKGGFVAMYKTVMDNQGKAAQVATTMNDNVSGSFTRLGSSLSAVRQAAFEPFQDSIQGVIDGMASAAAGVATWMGENQGAVKIIGMFGAGLFALGKAALTAKVAVAAFGWLGVKSLSTLARFTPLLGGMVRGFGLLRKALPYVATSVRAIGVAMMANPLGAAVGALAIAGTALVANWDNVVGWFETNTPKLHDMFTFGDFSALTDPFEGLFGWFKNVSAPVTAFFGGFLDGVGNQFAPVAKAIGEAFEPVNKMFSGLTGWFTSIDLSPVKDAFFGLRDSLAGIPIFKPVIWAMDLITDTASSVVGWFKGIDDAFASSASGARSWGEMAGEVFGKVLSFPFKLVGAFFSLPGKLVKVAPMIIEGLRNGLLTGVDSLLDTVGGIADGITSRFMKLLGIRSPSRVFMQQGDFLMQGLERGIAFNADKPFKALSGVGKRLGGAVAAGVVAPAVVMATPVAAPPPQAAANVTNYWSVNVEIAQVDASTTADDVAELIAAALEKVERDRWMQRNAALYDPPGY